MKETYLVNRGKLKFVFLFIVKNEALLLNEANDGCFPSRAFKECYQAVKNPVLENKKNKLRQTLNKRSKMNYLHFHLRLTTGLNGYANLLISGFAFLIFSLN